MRTVRLRSTLVATAGVGVLALLLSACSGSTSIAAGASQAGSCPSEPIAVVVSVNQWDDIAAALGGACTQVSTIVGGSSGDPHSYEPTPGDAVKFTAARLVVVNGANYDDWASKMIDTLEPRPAVVNAAVVAGVETATGESLAAGETPDDGEVNPHLWYDPTYVHQVAAAITEELKILLPKAGAYLEQQGAAWRTAMAPYDAKVATLKARAAGKTYGATEGVFDYLAQAIGLQDLTPAGWARAAANGSDPSPGDLQEFNTALVDKAMSVLIYNTQTEGSLPQLLRDTAASSGVPVVEITETVPSGASFVSWQLSQLTALAAALGVSG